MEYFTTQIFRDILTTAMFENADYPQEDSSSVLISTRRWSFSPGIDKFFKFAPLWQHVCAIWLLLLTGLVTNSVIIKIYWHLKSNNRIYVLAMAFMDLTALTFVLLPRFVLLFLGQSLVREVIELTRHGFAILIFTLYMFLPLFLAIDRFVAVSYPHKMRDKLRRLRPFKIGCAIQGFLQVLAVMATEILLGTESVWFKVVSSCAMLALILKVVSALTLYVIIAVKVTASRKKMKKHRSLNEQSRYSSKLEQFLAPF